MSKRLLDICLALLGLVVSSPVWLAAAIWIKLDSRGPVLFRQQRVGRCGRAFAILKFRTMSSVAVADGPQITVGSDPRITRAGAFLRRHKLDELPQFINVLLGDMSVVGPRPEVPRYVALYPADLRDIVLSVRPGITDAASLFYRDEAALLATSEDPEAFYAEVVLPAKLESAVQYVLTRSAWGDLVIVARTVIAILGRGQRSLPDQTVA